MKSKTAELIQSLLAGCAIVLLVNSIAHAQSTLTNRCPPVIPGLVGWWRAESNALDNVGTNHGTFQGAVGFATGQVGSAFSFVPAGGNVTIPYAPSILPSNYSIQAWIKPLSRVPSGGSAVFGQRDGRLLALQDSVNAGGHVVLQVFSPTGWVAVSTAQEIQTNQFTHVVATWDGTKANIFTNGVLSVGGSLPGPYSVSTSPFFIGGAINDLFFDGLIDEVRVYDRALTPAEAEFYYLEGLEGTTLVDGFHLSGRNGFFFNVPITNFVISLQQPLDIRAFNLTNIVVDGPMGRLQAVGITQLCERTYQIRFPALTVDGAYRFSLLPGLLGTNDLPLDLRLTGTPGESNEVVTFTRILDTVGPYLTQHFPSGGVTVGLGAMEIEFNKAIDSTTFNPADVTITNLLGQTVTVSGIQVITSNRFRITFPPLGTPGIHHLIIHPNMDDLAGNPLDQDQDGLGGEAEDDVDDICFYVHSGSGLVSGLVSWWRAEGSGFDSIGSNHGALQNAVGFQEGRAGDAFSMDGIKDYVEVPDDATLSPADALSVEAWYKPTVSFVGNGDNSIVDKGYLSHSPPYYQYHLGVVGDYTSTHRFRFSFDLTTGGTNVTVYTPSNFWSPGNWYHLVGTYDGNSVKLYVNGALIVSAPAGGTMTNYGRNLVNDNYSSPLMTIKIPHCASLGTRV